MKIAVVSSIFITNLGYLEESLAKVLTGMGHSVSVLTSFHYPYNYKSIKTPLLSDQTITLQKSGLSYSIIRLKTLLKFRSNIICLGLPKTILILQPDLIILVGISDFFPAPLLKKWVNGRFNIYAFIGQNYNMSYWQKSNKLPGKIRNYFINSILKRFLYRKSVRNLSRIFLYTPDSEEIIGRFLTPGLLKHLERKKTTIPLGYNSEDFYFSPEGRKKIRNSLKISFNELVIITVTRIDRSKKILEIIKELFIDNTLNLKYILIGFIENAYKKEIEKLIKTNSLQDNIICFPFLENEILINYLSAADIGIWLQSGASIQQAMGTGLPVILSKNNANSDLLREGFNGYYIENNLQETISLAVSHYSYNHERRLQIEQFNRDKLSFQSILKGII